jgi:cyclic-di-GMP phosphodiesterase TipF (flagellum assembly factor)
MLRLFRRRSRPRLRDQIAALARTSAELARQVAEISHRLAALEEKVNSTAGDWRDSSLQDVGQPSVQLRQMTEAVARHDAAVQTVLSPPAQAAPGPAKATADAASVAEAIADNRIELYLQPIVTLPQRKVRCYEATARLRGEDGDLVAVAERAGLVSKLDQLMLFRCVQVARRLQVKNRDVGVICHIGAATLTDADESKQMLDFITANQALAGVLTLSFSQADYRTLRPAARENLVALAARGFRFALDRVGDLRLDPRELADHGFRFLKAPAVLLLSGSAQAAELLARAGIDLIAEGIDDEGSALDLMDRDVRLGQGALFYAARPARPEALQANGAAAPAVLEAAAR